MEGQTFAFRWPRKITGHPFHPFLPGKPRLDHTGFIVDQLKGQGIAFHLIKPFRQQVIVYRLTGQSPDIEVAADFIDNQCLTRFTDKAIEWMKTMTWKGNQPVVHFLDKVYKKGIKVAKDEMKKYSEKIYKSTTIPRWNLAILGGPV